MTVVAVAGDVLVALDERHLHAGDDGFLADVEVAEAADEAHAVELAGLFLEAADEKHRAVGCDVFLAGEIGGLGGGQRSLYLGVSLRPGRRLARCLCHISLPSSVSSRT